LYFVQKKHRSIAENNKVFREETHDTIRVLKAKVKTKDLEQHQLNVKTVFLNSELKRNTAVF
jgi:hypothetical protein